MTILNDIVENTRAKLETKKAELPLAEIISKLNELNLPKGAFKESLLNKDQAIIAEIKKASPSAGIISEDFDPIKKAKEYEDFEETVLAEHTADIVNEPKHYARWVIEPITYIMRNSFEFWRGNIVKYASRAGYKLYEGMDQVQSEITDLEKVIRYSQMRINQLEGKDKL